ncbi:dienelactone hydrolase family protein [Dyella ginsengisoli]|uniref:dienelactone hydrolase family protein n=1 Tax=Dyella ginsengisoli TaxID=363848 RepID=UPI00034CF8FB|nr:dienelactone hydrolase family protein [Dyella ginsengisoli]
MGQSISLNTTRLHCIGAYLAQPTGKPRGGIVVVQEIFGVNAHMRAVTDRFAAAGYTAVAPCFFDHVESGVELDYDEAGFTRGRTLVSEVGIELAVDDVASAAEAIASAGRIGVVGFCWGGTVALRSAQRLGLPAVSYYGARNPAYLDDTPKAPVIFHFGERDPSIPPETVQQHREKLPQMPVYTYPAGHAFNRDVDPNAYDNASAALAWQRTLDFFAHALGGAA